MRKVPLLSGLSLTVATAGMALAAAPQPTTAPAPAVTIGSGRIDGITLPSGVRAYLGIPFAAPPVRALRWRDPQPPVDWQGVRHADHFAPQCIQPQRGVETNQYSGAEITSEDCLYINVWAKPQLKKAPVIVFIYGGGFFIGSSSMPLYGGEAVSREGAVFVNFNYRVGPLGFLAHPALSAESPHKTSGDYGFLDQIAALRWVRNNIAQFGGDPGNVTIAGQSAGSMSVLTLQASPLAKGLFQRAVGMSGALIGGASAMPALGEAEQEGLKLQTLLKVESIDQLRAMPADRIIIPRTPGGPKVGPIQDGYVLPEPIDRIFARSAQSDVPLMMGFTHDESLGGFGPVKDLADYRAKAAARFGTATAKFLELYPATSDAEARAAARAADRDATMASNMGIWADAQVAHGRAPVFSYEFSRPHSYAPGATFTDLDPATAGAYHTSEVPFWLGTLESFNRFRHTRDWTAADRAFSLAMTKALVAFAQSGSPDAGAVRWPRYSPSSRSLIELGREMRIGIWPDQRKFDFFRQAARPTTVAGSIRD